MAATARLRVPEAERRHAGWALPAKETEPAAAGRAAAAARVLGWEKASVEAAEEVGAAIASL
jgi:hypothetical protein